MRGGLLPPPIHVTQLLLGPVVPADQQAIQAVWPAGIARRSFSGKWSSGSCMMRSGFMIYPVEGWRGCMLETGWRDRVYSA